MRPDEFVSRSAWQQASSKTVRREVVVTKGKDNAGVSGANRLGTNDGGPASTPRSSAYHRRMSATALDILDFWFGPPPHAPREAWFRKDPAFDAQIRRRFGDVIAAALAGAYGEWCTSASGALARVILLDQFARNVFRDTPDAFAGDAAALATAADAVDRGLDAALDPYERKFLYMPFEHSEDLAQQERSVALFTMLAQRSGDLGGLDWAEKHEAIIRRFGRFPHRNAILGRESTAEETAFLGQPGSRF